MPGKVKVKIIAGRNLPVMDRSSDTTDAYVEIKLGNTTYKTDVCRKSLNPQWNSEWYRFEVDDSELQDEPLQIRLMDHDTYSANDAIGKVYLNLNPLLIPAGALPGKYGWGGDTNVDQPSSSVMSGWIPVYDTMHGIRGEVNVTVKVELFSDFNKFRQSSCGVQFFCSPDIPHGFHAQVIHGFIEELVVNDDPEYQWIDKIRTPRASNEARQTLFFKLSGELQRKIGVKALDLGGNAVIGYKQCFDLEGESGIVARGIGTVVTLVKHHEMQQQQLDIGIAEEKALSYLKFLAFDNGLKLENDNIFERFMLSSSPISNTSVFVSTPDNFKDQFARFTPNRNLLRQTSQPLIEYEPLPRNLKTCISSRSLSDDLRKEVAWRQILRQEEMKGSSARLSNKIRLLKQNMLYKKMNAFKTKLLEESLNSDTVSITTKDDPSDIRTSLMDLRELRKRKKQSNSSCMAELLVRSVIHAHTSLDCIVEGHDSVPLLSTSTSALNEEVEEDIVHQNDSQKIVHEKAQTSFINKTISEPYLLLPDNTIVNTALNSSSESELSSSEGSDSPVEIKDKLDFDTVSLIVRNVQDEEIKQRRLSQVQNIVQSSVSDNLLELPADVENKIEKIRKRMNSNTTESKNKGKLTKTLSKSHADVTELSTTKINNADNNGNICDVILPVNIEKRIESLRHSALFRSIVERPKSTLNKTFSISYEDVSSSVVDSPCNITTNFASSSIVDVTKFEEKRRMSKAFSISCEEIYSSNLEETQNRIDELEGSVLSKRGREEPKKRGKLEKMFSISCDDNFEQEPDSTVILPIDIEKKIKNLLHSPLFEPNLEPRRRKMNRGLSRSCADISSPNNFEVIYNENLLSKNIEKKIDMFKNSPLFKISIMTEPKPKGKLNRELSKSHADITNISKSYFDAENNSKSNPDFGCISLVKTAMHTILSEKINLLTLEPAPISPKASEILLYRESDPDVTDNSLLKNAVQTILIEKIDLMTSQYTPVSKRVQEEFQKNVANSISRSDPDISSHFLKSAINKIHSPSIFLRKSRDSYTGPLRRTASKSDPSLLERSSAKSLIDKIHHSRSKSRSISHKFEVSAFNIDIKSMSHSPPHSAMNDNSLVKAAMETMLMDKINILTPPVSSGKQAFEFHQEKDIFSTKYPNIPSGTSEQDDNDGFGNTSLFKTSSSHSPSDREPILKSSKHPHLDKIKCTVHNVLDKVHILSPKTTGKNLFTESETNFTKTAMQTMLIDKVHLIAPDATPNTNTDEEPNHSSNKHESSKLDKIKTVVHNVCDKVSHLSPTSSSSGKKFDFEKDEHEPSLMKTAMQTMLIDKVNILAPEASTAAEEAAHHDPKPPVAKHDHPKLDKIKEAVHTVLDKVSHFSPTPRNENEFNFSEQEPSLMKTAMDTMLIDKINIIASDATPVAVEDFEDLASSPPKHEAKHEHFDKVRAAVHTVIDKVHHLSKHEEPESDQSLVKTAMQTMLLDKVNIIAPNSPSVSQEVTEFQFEPAPPTASYETKETMFDNPQNEYENQTSLEIGMRTLVMDETSTMSPHLEARLYNFSDQTDSCETLSSSKSGRKHSLFSTFKNKIKSFKSKVSLPKFIHKNRKSKDDDLIETPSKGILKKTGEPENKHSEPEQPSLFAEIFNCDTTLQEEMDLKNSGPSEQTSSPIEPVPKACIKKKIDITLTLPSTEEPNITVRPDTGDSCNRSAVTGNVANCNTNAEHAPCLHTSDRRIVESPVSSSERERERDRENIRESRERHGHQRTESTGCKISQSPARLNTIPCIHRRSSDSDLSITPKGNSLTGSDRSGGTIPGYHHIRSTLLRPTVDNFDMMEFPFLTMAKYPPGFVLHLGGAVSARSVKLLERITNIEEPETRDTWWSEIRTEIRTHARALNCNAVLGYTESTSICDEVCVLSASGTAAVIALYSGELTDGVGGLPNLHKTHIPNKDLMTTSLDRTDFERDKNAKHSESSNANSKITQVSESPEHGATIEFSGAASTQIQPLSCRICHIPYSESTMSFRINMLYCSMCKMAKVPDIILTTIEMPEGLPITGRGCFLQSYVCRPKRDLKGELNAKEISESLPFLEYELHRLLVNKMKVKAMNTIFGLKVRITIGERLLIGIATGTAVFLLPLPPPPLPKLIAGNSTTEDKRLTDMQKLLVDTVKKNKEIYELKDVDIVQPSKLLSDTEESDDEKSNLDLGAGNKDSCVLEVDDSEDIEVINLLVEPRPPDGFHVVNTENVPGLEELEIVKNLQMFTQVWRAKIPLNQSASHFGKHFQKLLQSVYFKLRRMIPCALCDLQFRVDLPEPDEIQLTLLGMALGLGDPMKLSKYKRKNLCHLPAKEHTKKPVDDELIFSLEEDQIPENSIPVISQGLLLNPQMSKHRQKSPQRLRVNTKQRHTPVKERHGVDITPLSYVPGGKIERYLGYLNFFFIRETTSIREGGGLSGFVHSFITEVLAIVRAHVTALGGNAMVAYFMTECVLYHNAHKNQGQCLINVGGDVVFVSYFTEDN